MSRPSLFEEAKARHARLLAERAGAAPSEVATVPAAAAEVKEPKVDTPTPAAVAEAPAVKPVAAAVNAATLRSFYADVLPRSGHYALFIGPTKQHVWCSSVDELVAETQKRQDERDVYFATASFVEAGTEWGGRRAANVARLRAFRLDIDAGPEKYAKHPEDVYPDLPAAKQAMVSFLKAKALSPSYVIQSGAGLHVYFCLDDDIAPDRWVPVAQHLQLMCRLHDLKADGSVTADAARVLRPLGSLHKSGARVQALRVTPKIHTLEQFSEAIGYRPRQMDLSVNDDVLAPLPGPPKSVTKVIERCGALRHATTAQNQVPEPYWRATLGLVKHTVEGEEAAHRFSSEHRDYDEAETQRKLDGWTAGPATCDEFSLHYTGCKDCEYRGKVKSPIVLGTMDVAEVQALPDEVRGAQPVAEYVAEFNARFAVVRVGSDVAIVDKRSPIVTATGVRESIGLLSIAAFKQMHAGSTVRIGDRDVAKADAWLRHPQRAQFEGMAFAPGEELPSTLLNLWTGYAVDAVAGDVSPWTELLDSLIPDTKVRAYVLRWLAWKVQNPGGVPGTIVLLYGGKGVGKNSLVDPIVSMFGAAGRVFDDAEQIAGRFTGHLMSVAFAVLDEALFAGDPRQNDRVKARVTATSMTYEHKGQDPIQGVNRCAYVSLSNHAHVWAATVDERRAVAVEVADTLRGNREFWTRYHRWLHGEGPAALLHFLRSLDLAGFDRRVIPRTQALQRQVQHTALRDPVVSWWHSVLDEGTITVRRSGTHVRHELHDEGTAIDKATLREAYESCVVRGTTWSAANRQLQDWTGGMKAIRRRSGTDRCREVQLPGLSELRSLFTSSTGVAFEPLDRGS